MAHDETEFDKLLKETREWEARDRARHKGLGMNEDARPDGFAPASRAPSIATGELGKKAAVKQAQGQSETTRARRKGAWGWMWVLILLYFLFRHFVR